MTLNTLEQTLAALKASGEDYEIKGEDILKGVGLEGATLKIGDFESTFIQKSKRNTWDLKDADVPGLTRVVPAGAEVRRLSGGSVECRFHHANRERVVRVKVHPALVSIR